jgi:hypothetical protein
MKNFAAVLLTCTTVVLSGCGANSSTSKSANHRPPATGADANAGIESKDPLPILTTAGAEHVSAKMLASTDHPRVHQPFSLHITATSDGKPASGRINYVYIHHGKVLARSPSYRFAGGSFDDTFPWPELPGNPNEFWAVVSTAKGRVGLAFFVTVM